jgi:hypothetical protein
VGRSQPFDSEFGLSITVCGGISDDIADPVLLCACDVHREYSKRVHFRPRHPVKRGLAQVLERGFDFPVQPCEIIQVIALNSWIVN